MENDEGEGEGEGEGDVGRAKRRRRNDPASNKTASDQRDQRNEKNGRNGRNAFSSPPFHSGIDHRIDHGMYNMGEPDLRLFQASSSGQYNRYGSSAPHHLLSTPAQLYHTNFVGSIDRFVRALVSCFDPHDRGNDRGGGGGRSGEREEAGGGNGGVGMSAVSNTGASSSGAGASGGGGASGVLSSSTHGLLPLAVLCTPTCGPLTYPAADITPSHIDILDGLWAQAEEEDHTARALEVILAKP